MRIRDSGMPDVSQWESLLRPRQTLAALGFSRPHDTLVDIGCGYGTFTLTAATTTDGIVYAFDIDPAMIATATRRATEQGLTNVCARQRDCLADGTGLADASVDAVMLFNVLHAREPLTLLEEARRILKPDGCVAITHWIHDADTPRGPVLAIRPRPEQCRVWLAQAGFDVTTDVIDLPPYHFGLIGRKPSA